MAFWESAWTQLRQLWGGLSLAQRGVFFAVAAGLAAGFTALAFWAGTPDYAVLYGRLPADDAAEVVERLRSEAVPYRLEDGGRTVLVPSERVYDLRLLLAGEGVPHGGVVGFEIFDRSSFGITDFAQKVNYTRALEGELTRTIRRLDGVEGARVHVVLPERRLFETEQQPAAASVVLQLGAGRSLGVKQTQAVVYLVSSSVPGLDPGRVNVVDTQGRVLHRASDDEVGFLASSQLEHKRAYEGEAERRIREMLERVLGSGTAVVQVSARFDFDRVEETAEVFDPEAVAVRSEQRHTESGPGGTGDGSRPVSIRDSETVSYEVSKRVTRVQRAPGSLDRLTVAVAVDGTYREGGGTREFVPRSPEELAGIRALVEKAVGADTSRGDEVEVTSIPFRPAEIPEEPTTRWDPGLASQLARFGAVSFVALLVVFGVVRPGLRWLGASRGPSEITEPVTVAELERRLAAQAQEGGSPGGVAVTAQPLKGEALRARLSEMVHAEPEVAAQLLRSWMTEE
ncbi:MAG: flagellar basal-body MS-ring/collar protein FliF [Deferrisomatales bacterium]|nr:flagellar basal-body MS-ring/collar protein FliF [Deferrisomatales bacterium]